MNLMEALVSAAVFAGATSASAQLLGAGSRWTLAAEARQERQERLEAAVLALEHQVREEARMAPLPGSCGEAATTLASTLGTIADGVGDGVTRQVQMAAAGQQVLVTLSVAGGDPVRQRLFSPAALGLCGPVGDGGSGDAAAG